MRDKSDEGPGELSVSWSPWLFPRLTDPTTYYQDLMASLQPSIRGRWVIEPCTRSYYTALILEQPTHLRTEARSRRLRKHTHVCTPVHYLLLDVTCETVRALGGFVISHIWWHRHSTTRPVIVIGVHCVITWFNLRWGADMIISIRNYLSSKIIKLISNF